MKKGLKILSTSLLLSTLVFAGCSCNKEDGTNVSRIENGSNPFLTGVREDASKYTLLDVYNALIADDAGNKAVADKLVDLVASEVLELNSETSVWKSRYDALVKEKLTTLAESDTYLVKGEFSEKFMIESLEAEGYSITCPSGVSYGTVDNLACDYTNYINKMIKVDVLSTLLKEKYIYDETLESRKNIITTKDVRDVEYISISSSLDSDFENLSVRDFMRQVRDKIANKEVVDFKTIEKEFKDELKEIIEKEYAKIGTSDDYDQSIAAEYTNNFTQSAKEGYDAKIEAINDSEYVFNKVISSNSDSAAIVSENITSTLLSIDNPTDTSVARKVIAVKDTNEVTNYYLVSVNAGVSVDASDVLLSETSDSSTYTYSIVKFKVINSDTTDEAEIYKAVKVMASESTLASNALAHYIKQKKDVISVYDDEVYTYLSTLYPDVFAD